MKPSEALEYIKTLPEAQRYEWDVGFEDNAGELVVVMWVGNKGFRHLIGLPGGEETYEKLLRHAVIALLNQAERWQKMLADHEALAFFRGREPARKGGHR